MNRTLTIILLCIGSISVKAQLSPAELLDQVDTFYHKYSEDSIRNLDDLLIAQYLLDYNEQTYLGYYWLSRGRVYSALYEDPHVIQNKALLFETAQSSYKRAADLGVGKESKEELNMGLLRTMYHLESKLTQNQFKDIDAIKASAEEIKNLYNSLQSGHILKKPNYSYANIALAVAQWKTDNLESAQKLLLESIDRNDEFSAYAYLLIYYIYKENSPTKAKEFLNEGLTFYPNDMNLVFEDINNHIVTGDYDGIINKLENTIALNQENQQLYMVLAGIYDRLYSEREVEEYFEKAKFNYEKAIALDEGNTDGIYSLGALYFNKAVKLQALANSFPTTEKARFDEFNNESILNIKKALPLFTKAERLNPNDVYVLQGLKESYLTLGDHQRAEAIQKRIIKIRSGQNFSEPFAEHLKPF